MKKCIETEFVNLCCDIASSGAHKRKAAIPHRRDELVAHTAQSLIVPNGVLLDLDGDRLGSCGSVGVFRCCCVHYLCR